MTKRIKMLTYLLIFICLLGFAAPSILTDAAAKPKLNQKERTLYVGGSKATNVSGTYVFKLQNKPKKYSITWSIKDPSIASVTKLKGGKASVSAKAIGKTVLTASVVDKTTKSVSTLTASVIIKKNASSVKFDTKNMKSETLTVGEAIQLGGSMYDNENRSGTRGQYVTDYMTFLSSNPSIVSITATGQLKAIAPGEATITLYTYQSSKYKDVKYATAKDSINVKVVGGLEKAEQISLNKMKLTFYKEIETEVKEDTLKGKLTVDRVVSGTSQSVGQGIDKIEFAGNRKTVLLTMANSFETDSVYNIYYETDSRSFTAKSGKITKLVPYTLEGNNVAIVRKPTTIQFQFIDEYGIDVTPLDKTAYTTLINRIALKTDSKDCLLDGKDILFLSEDKNASVVATLLGNNASGSQIEPTTTIVSTVDITSVNETSLIVPGGFSLEKETKGADVAWNTPLTSCSALDVGYKMIVTASLPDGIKIYSDDKDSKFSFETQDKNTLIIDGLTGELYPIKQGTAIVSVKYNAKLLTTYEIQIDDKRQAERIEFNATSFFVSGVREFSEQKIQMKVFDQNGQLFKMINEGTKAKGVTIACNESIAPIPTAVANNDGTVTIVLNAAGYSTQGKGDQLYNYTVSYEGISNNFSIIVRWPSGTTSTFGVETTVPRIDMKLVNGSVSLPVVEINLYEYRNSVKYAKVPVHSKNYSNLKYGDYYYTVMANNQEIAAGLGEKGFEPITLVNNVATKTSEGVYTVSVYKRTSSYSELVAQSTFELYDTQEKPSIEFLKSYTAYNIVPEMSSESVKLILSECFRFKFKDQVAEKADLEPKYQIVGSSAIYFESVKIRQTYSINNTTVFYYTEVPLGKTVSYQKY